MNNQSGEQIFKHIEDAELLDDVTFRDLIHAFTAGKLSSINFI